MIENITVIDNNKNEIFAEGISHIQFLSSGKRTLLYTLNEQAANDRIKMYVAELANEPGVLGKIPDEEWAKLRPVLEKIERGEINSDIKFLSLANTPFNIGIPKKLAITAEMKQSFKDKQAAGVLASQQQQMVDAPAVEASNGGFFNKEEVDQTPAFVSPDSMAQDQVNIFNNPMKPEVVPDLAAGGVVEQGSVQAIGQQGGTQMVEGMMPQGQNMMNGQTMNNPQMVTPSLATIPDKSPMSQSQIIQTPEMTIVPESVPSANNYNPQATLQNTAAVQEGGEIIDNPFIVNPMPSISVNNAATDMANALETASLTDTGNSIQYQQGLAANLSNDLGLATGINVKSDNSEVTKEEALAALEILNRYFKNTKELPSDLANEINIQAKEENKNIDASNKQETSGEITILNDEPSELSFAPQSEIVSLEGNNGIGDMGITEEKGRVLSLAPEGNSGMVQSNIGMEASIPQIPQVNSTQVPIAENQNIGQQNIIPGPGFDGQMGQPIEMQTGYVASTNGPAVNMSTTTDNINEVPVVLPDNYNPQAVINNNVVMGPGSLPADNYAKVA